MPFLVRDLINIQRPPVTVHPDDSLQVALTRMTEHEFSQLPVVDAEDRLLGMVTSDSILRALKAFGVAPSSLHVRDAKTKTSAFRADDDLFDLLDDLRDSYSVVTVDEDRRVTGIVTGYDATEYFRRRTENMMFVEDIELTLKDHIQSAHADSSGEPDETMLKQSIKQCTGGASKNRKRFLEALHRYLDRCDPPDGLQRVELNAAAADEVFAQVFESAPKPFDELTFADYEELLLSKQQWPRYASAFEPLTPDSMRHMLESVRETRNVLAHFRADITPEQRERLKFCFDWFAEHPAVRLQQADMADSASTSSPYPSGEDVPPSDGETHDVSVEDRLEAADFIEVRDSRYAQLAIYLVGLPRDRDRVKLTFAEIEEIIQGPLPPYARQHRAFWANDAVSHPQSRQWLEVDWRVSNIDMANEVVVFSRIREREKQYIDFYSALLAELRSHATFAIRNISPVGLSWITIAGVPERGPHIGFIGFSFARNHRFRIELYIDSGNMARNKQLFDHICMERHEIERQLLVEQGNDALNPPVVVSWERLEERRACRIALYCPGSITDGGESRNRLRAWAVTNTPRFQSVVNAYVSEAVREGL